jgi:hypothetical protein
MTKYQDGIGSAWTWPWTWPCGLKASFRGHGSTHSEKTLWPRWPIPRKRSYHIAYGYRDFSNAPSPVPFWIVVTQWLKLCGQPRVGQNYSVLAAAPPTWGQVLRPFIGEVIGWDFLASSNHRSTVVNGPSRHGARQRQPTAPQRMLP